MSVIPRYIEVRAKDNVLQSDKTVVMVKGEKYLIPLGWIDEKINRRFITIVSDTVDDIWKPFDMSKDLNNKKLLVVRTAGIGDMVFLSPIFNYIKTKYPTAQIGMACAHNYNPILRLIPNIDKILPMPVPVDSLDKYDYHLSFMYSIESETGTENDENCYDLLFKAIAIDPSSVSKEYKKPHLKSISPAKIPYNNLVGIQPFAGVAIRDMPKTLVVDLVKELNKRGKTVFIIADPNEHKLIDLANLLSGLNVVFPNAFENTKDIYEVCKIIKNCEWIITPDSSFAHIGPGLGVKTISIYGPFSAASRTLHYNNSWSIDTQPSCRCRAHTLGQCPRGKYPSPCMDIDKSYILDIILEQGSV